MDRRPVDELAADAIYLISDDALPGEMERLSVMAPAEVLAYFYTSSDCDDFAVVLAGLVDGEVVGAVSPAQGPLHRLVRMSDGRLLDAKGWQSVPTLIERYGATDLELAEVDPFSAGDEGQRAALEAMWYLADAPFQDDWLRTLLARAFSPGPPAP